MYPSIPRLLLEWLSPFVPISMMAQSKRFNGHSLIRRSSSLGVNLAPALFLVRLFKCILHTSAKNISRHLTILVHWQLVHPVIAGDISRVQAWWVLGIHQCFGTVL